MAIMWQQSLVPWTKANGDPYAGAVVEFFDANTTTPQTVYTDPALSISAGLADRTADAGGKFGALYLNPDPGSYRVKITDADDAVIWDVDEQDVPQSATYVPPEAGETSESLLFRTGMMVDYYGTTSPSGWVRAAGRTIGSGASAATERANDDTEDLFLHLWGEDSTLSVSGGRGGTAAADWAANKTIALPDFRERVAAGLATMGNTDAGLVADSLVDGGETSSTLGATAGADDVALIIANMPAHDHGGATTNADLHGHTWYESDRNTTVPEQNTSGGFMKSNSVEVSRAAYTGTVSATDGQNIGGGGAHEHDIPSQGSGTAHNNMQPTMFVTKLIKL